MPTLAAIVGYVPANFNMLPWSSAFATSTDFTNSGYTATRSSISSGVTSPDGTTNAQKLVEDSSNNTHFVFSNNGPQTCAVSPIVHRVAFIAKAAERTRIVALYQSIQDANSQVSIGFDLAGGNVGYDNVVGSNATLVDADMSAVGGGWWLGYFDVQYNLTPAAATNYWEQTIYLDAGSGTAARDIIYAGNGSSGVDLWWFSYLPKQAWDLTNLVFHDDFDDLSTIDLSDTRAPGFKWYVHNLFPNSFMTTFGWTTNPPSSPTQASYLTIDSPSVLKIYNPNTNQNGYTSQIWSVATDGGSGYVGSAFKPPLAYDGYFNWDGSKAFADSHTHMAGVPAFWGSSIEALTGAPVSGHFLEWDIFEGSGNSGPGGSLSGGTTKHDWSNPSSPVDDRIGYELLLPMVLGTFMRISGIWLPMDSNGWGIFLAFVNGQFKNNSDTIYNSSSVALAGGLAVGEFSHSDSQHLTIFLDTGENSSSPGGGWPFYIDWVKVYTTGSAPTAKSGTRMSLGVGLGLTMN